jgi:hypothetical protein
MMKDVRACSELPHLSLHDSYVEETASTVSWTSADTSFQCEEEMTSALDSQHVGLIPTDSPTTHIQASSEVQPIEKPSIRLPPVGKRQRLSTGGIAVKKRKLASSQAVVRFKLPTEPDEHLAAPTWAKSVIVRLQPSADQVVPELLYTFVKLPAPDVDRCTAAICTKLNIPFTRGMPVSWVDSKTSLQGPFDHAFLRDMPDMQDFVIGVIKMGMNEDIGLLLVTDLIHYHTVLAASRAKDPEEGSIVDCVLSCSSPSSCLTTPTL